MDIKNSLKIFIQKSQIVTLATSEKNKPWICNVFYIPDKDLNLYFLSGKKTIHSQHLEKNFNVAVSIYDHKSNFDGVQGVQMIGIVKELGIVAALKILPKFRKVFRAHLTKADLKEAMGSRFYRFTPRKIFYRNSRGFKGKQEVRL
jgi:uncharacterized protein YhbP (UPF0306 family)